MVAYIKRKFKSLKIRWYSFLNKLPSPVLITDMHPKLNNQTKRIAGMYIRGATIGQIAEIENLTRERVKQVLLKIERQYYIHKQVQDNHDKLHKEAHDTLHKERSNVRQLNKKPKIKR